MLCLIASVAISQSDILDRHVPQAGWKTLFDGKSMKGWHSWKGTGVKSGWKIENGVLTCADPHTAGDIVTDEKFDWFELSIDVNLGKDQNSGIMFRVTDEGLAPWHSGPEVQLYDHPQQEGVETTGFLYQLYTSKTDAAKPAGQWNHLRIVIDPNLCYTEVNGVRYYEFVWGSEDFWARVKKSKFSKYPFFAKADKGSIGLQGDHGIVSYRNIRIRPIRPN